MLHPRRGLSDDDDCEQVIHSLQVAAIVPAEMLLLPLNDADDHCSSPCGGVVTHRLIPTLHCSSHIRERIAALESVALIASRASDLAKLGTDIATLGADAVGETGHL